MGNDPVSDKELLAEVERLADGDDPPKTTDMKQNGEYCVTTFVNHFGSWNAAVAEAGFEARNQGSRIPTEELLAEIERLANGSNPPSSSDMKEKGKYSHSLFADRFGSWTAAVEEAGFEPSNNGKRIPEEELLAEIKRLADGDDPPTSADMNAHGEYCQLTYHERFGSWTTAVEEAGFKPSDRGRAPIPEEELLAEIKRLADGDDPPTSIEMNENGEYTAITAINRFGSWNAALEEAGFEPRNRGEGTSISEEELLAEIERLADGDYPPTTADMNQEGQYSDTVYIHRFGSWNAAVEEAGFKPRNKGTSIAEEELLAEIERLADGDNPPTAVDMNQNGQYSTMAYNSHFRSWSAAVEEAGFDPRNRGEETSISEEELLAEIERLADGDYPPTTADMNQEGQYSDTPYIDRFGSWSAAVEEAGFKPRNRGTSISEEELLAEIERLADGDDPPTTADMNQDGQYSASVYYQHFSSWNAALEETGCKP